MPKPVLSVVRGVRQRALAADDALTFKAKLAALCREVPGAASLLPVLQAEIDRETTPSQRWDFVMLNVFQNAAALRLIRTEAKRPMLSVAAWEQIMQHLDPGSGVLLLTRDQLAEKLGVPPNRVSAVLSEFCRWNVLIRFQSGRSALWQFNPNIATRLPGAAGEAARRAAGPVLRLVPRDEGGTIQDAAQPELPV